MPGKNKGAVVVSGASTGIGKECALLLDRSGYKVFAGVRKMEAGENLRKESSKNLSPVILDVTDPKQIASAFDAIEEDLDQEDGLKGLINNAGIGLVGPVEFMPISVLRRHLEVNVIGHIAVTQQLLSLVRKGQGRIINMGSGSGRFALPLLGAYAASKFAFEALTDSLRRELQPWGVFVSIVEPGTVETTIWEKGIAETDKLIAGFPNIANELYDGMFSSGLRIMGAGRRRAVSPKAVAKIVQKALESKRPRTRYVVGTDARMAVLGSLLPDRLTDWVISKIFSRKLPSRTLGW
jgi:NAD(P)-dependent dehydrogenase (short-subunit alcohol dehydrogenase family)